MARNSVGGRPRFAAAMLAGAVTLTPGLGLAAQKRDIVVDAPLSVLEKPANQDRIGRDVTFRFAAAFAPTPRQGRLRGRQQVLNSGDVQRDCEAALVKTLKDMAQVARKRGGHSVVEIHSLWAGVPTSSTRTYRCARGSMVTSVSLIGVLEGSR